MAGFLAQYLIFLFRQNNLKTIPVALYNPKKVTYSNKNVENNNQNINRRKETKNILFFSFSNEKILGG